MPAMNVLTPYGAGILQALFASQTLFLGVGPSIVAGALVEFTDTVYARQPLTMVAAGPLSANGAGVSFGPAPIAGWTAAASGIFTALTAGNCWTVGALDAPIIVPSGQLLTFLSNTLVFQFVNPS